MADQGEVGALANDGGTAGEDDDEREDAAEQHATMASPHWGLIGGIGGLLRTRREVPVRSVSGAR